jgi:hypothetical protein
MFELTELQKSSLERMREMSAAILALSQFVVIYPFNEIICRVIYW